LKVGRGVHALAALSGDGRWVATYGDDGLQLWDRSHPDIHRTLDGFKGSIRSIVFSPDSRALLAAGADGTARVWEVERVAPPRLFRSASGRALMSAAFDAQGRRVVLGTTDGTVNVWKVEGEELLAVLRRHGEAVNDVRFSPDGAEILSASDDGTVKLGRCETCSHSDGELESSLDAYALLDREGTKRLNEILNGSGEDDRERAPGRSTTP
jgi:WD40 repeat protein